MSTQLAKADGTQLADLKHILTSERMQAQFAAALPSHLSAERFARIAITALTRTPGLVKCTQASLFKCLLDLSALGLEPDGRHAHLIPYKDECTLILDYKGLVALIRRSGEVAKIHADVVCENDAFEHSMGEVTRHTYDLRKERGEPYAAYAQVTLKDGSVQASIMSRGEVDAIRKRSRAGGNGPWVTDWNEMAKKTAFRRLTKWLTISPEFRDALDRDDDRPEERQATAREVAVKDFLPSTPAPEPKPEQPPETGDATEDLDWTANQEGGEK